MKRPRVSADLNAVKSRLPGGSAVGRQQAGFFCSGLFTTSEECAHKSVANRRSVTAPAETLHGGKS